MRNFIRVFFTKLTIIIGLLLCVSVPVFGQNKSENAPKEKRKKVKVKSEKRLKKDKKKAIKKYHKMQDKPTRKRMKKASKSSIRRQKGKRMVRRRLV
ncbi:hypothetical protein DNU06_16085 [Putridiphycobacter roseus]|uniref:Uncharacterized protein n=1 Tax=Putridiphycobacter roseus TaxID=2219161 RepID=A0A2W1MXA2_9FLAO|nr:hypothetical protein [Putridiphycobacter roseus]PZE15790.1 hypothetical protein DNU06_16085 [Putridiphycobacter roseus]